MKKRNSFNSVIFRDPDSKAFIYATFENGKIVESYKVNLEQDFMKDEHVNGRFPKNKIVFSDIQRNGETDITISPRFCVEIKFKQKGVDFWNILENPLYFDYFMNQINSRLS